MIYRQSFILATNHAFSQLIDCSSVIPQPPALNDKIEFPPGQFLKDIDQSVSRCDLFFISVATHSHNRPSVIKCDSLTSPLHQVSIFFSK